MRDITTVCPLHCGKLTLIDTFRYNCSFIRKSVRKYKTHFKICREDCQSVAKNILMFVMLWQTCAVVWYWNIFREFGFEIGN